MPEAVRPSNDHDEQPMPLTLAVPSDDEKVAVKPLFPGMLSNTSRVPDAANLRSSVRLDVPEFGAVPQVPTAQGKGAPVPSGASGGSLDGVAGDLADMSGATPLVAMDSAGVDSTEPMKRHQIAVSHPAVHPVTANPPVVDAPVPFLFEAAVSSNPSKTMSAESEPSKISTGASSVLTATVPMASPTMAAVSSDISPKQDPLAHSLADVAVMQAEGQVPEAPVSRSDAHTDEPQSAVLSGARDNETMSALYADARNAEQQTASDGNSRSDETMPPAIPLAPAKTMQAKFNPLADVMIYVVVFIGGFIGTALRYGLSLLVPSSETGGVASAFHVATFAVNMVACFLYALCTTYLTQASWVRKRVRQLTNRGVGMGMCGGMSTLSTLAIEELQSLHDGNVVGFVVYTSITFAVGLMLAWIGTKIAISAGAKRSAQVIAEAFAAQASNQAGGRGNRAGSAGGVGGSSVGGTGISVSGGIGTDTGAGTDGVGVERSSVGAGGASVGASGDVDGSSAGAGASVVGGIGTGVSAGAGGNVNSGAGVVGTDIGAGIGVGGDMRPGAGGVGTGVDAGGSGAGVNGLSEGADAPGLLATDMPTTVSQSVMPTAAGGALTSGGVLTSGGTASMAPSDVMTASSVSGNAAAPFNAATASTVSGNESATGPVVSADITTTTTTNSGSSTPTVASLGIAVAPAPAGASTGESSPVVAAPGVIALPEDGAPPIVQTSVPLPAAWRRYEEPKPVTAEIPVVPDPTTGEVR